MRTRIKVFNNYSNDYVTTGNSNVVGWHSDSFCVQNSTYYRRQTMFDIKGFEPGIQQSTTSAFKQYSVYFSLLWCNMIKEGKVLHFDVGMFLSIINRNNAKMQITLHCKQHFQEV